MEEVAVGDPGSRQPGKPEKSTHSFDGLASLVDILQFSESFFAGINSFSRLTVIQVRPVDDHQARAAGLCPAQGASPGAGPPRTPVRPPHAAS